MHHWSSKSLFLTRGKRTQSGKAGLHGAYLATSFPALLLLIEPKHKNKLRRHEKRSGEPNGFASSYLFSPVSSLPRFSPSFDSSYNFAQPGKGRGQGMGESRKAGRVTHMYRERERERERDRQREKERERETQRDRRQVERKRRKSEQEQKRNRKAGEKEEEEEKNEGTREGLLSLSVSAHCCALFLRSAENRSLLMISPGSRGVQRTKTGTTGPWRI